MSKELTPEEKKQIKDMLDLYEEERFYQLLAVHPKASQEHIRTAYYGLSRQWHPDRFFNREVGEFDKQIERVFMGITKAYRTLSSPEERLHFDRTHVTTTTSSGEVKSVQNKARYRKGPRRRRREREATDKTTPRKEIKTAKQRRRDKVLNQVKKTVDSQKSRAKHFYELAKKDLEAERPMQAAASLHIACKLEPDNEEFRKLYVSCKKKARSAKALEIFASAENAENFQNYQEALSLYKKAVEYEVEDARAYSRLAYLLEKLAPDPRESMRLMQIAVRKAPENPEYHCILGEIYSKEGMNLNARREFTKALEIQKNYQRAKDGLKKL